MFLFLPVLHLVIYHAIYVALLVGHHKRHRNMSPQRYPFRHEARGRRWTVFFLSHRGMRRVGSSKLHAMCVEIEQQPQSGIRFAMALSPPGEMDGVEVDSPGAWSKKRTNLEGLI